MLLWKRQSQVAGHALEKAKGTYALGKASGFWKMALEKVDLGVDIAGLMQRHHEKCVKKGCFGMGILKKSQNVIY